MFGQSLLSAFGIACTTDTDQLFVTTTSTASLATYQLNNATTSIPSNTYPGTASNITYGTGKFGNAASFNGSSSYIRLPANFLNSSTQTISMWVNPSSVSGNGMLYSSYDYQTGPSKGTYMRLNSGGQIQFTVHDGDCSTMYPDNPSCTAVTQLISPSSITVNTWTHVVGVIGGSGNPMAIYINGVKVISTATMRSVGYWSGKQPLIGATDYVVNGTSYPPEAYFNGSIDQVRFFSSVLSQAAITALYNETTTTATSASVDYQGANPNSVAYYKMSDATDQLGNYNGTATNVNFNTEGKFGFAGAFNGSSSVITLPAAFSSTYEGSTTWSFSAWVDVNSSNADKNFFTKYNSSVQVGGIQIGTDASGYLNFFVADTSDNRQHNRGNTALSTNTWHHICVIWSSGTMYLYLNGSAETLTNLSNTYTGSTIPTTTTSSTKSNRFGAITYSNGSTSYSDIKLDQIRIYDSALSAANVSTLYKEVECEPAAINALDHFNTVLYTGNGASSRSITGVGFAPDFTWTKKRGPSTANHLLQNIVNGAGTGSALYSASNGAAGSIDQYGYISAFGTDGVTYQAGSSGSYPSDLNNENNSTYVAWNWKAPLANLSTSFNGSNSTITIANNAVFNFTTPTSLSVWVNRNTTSRDFIIDKGNGSSGSYGWQFEYNNSQYVFQLNNTVGGIMDIRATTTSGTGIWDHVAVTYDSNQVGKIYLNGVLKATDTMSGTASFNTNGVTIGKYSLASGYEFDGKLAQVRFFNSTLSASEVSDLYAEPAASNNTLNYPAGAGCIAAYPLQTNAVDLSGNYSGASSNVTFGQPGYLTSNTDGAIPSTVAANVEAGFSIVSYTGNEQASQTVGHGLSSSPEIAFIKQLDGGRDWIVPLFTETSGDYMELNDSATKATDTNKWSAVSSTTFTVGADPYTNGAGSPYIAYCFTSIPGYSKVGSYIGQTAGVTIYTGFQPRFIMVKASQATYPENWAILDAVRGSGKCLNPNLGNAETDSTLNTFTTTATGFSFPNQNIADAMLNENGYTYTYLAIA